MKKQDEKKIEQKILSIIEKVAGERCVVSPQFGVTPEVATLFNMVEHIYSGGRFGNLVWDDGVVSTNYEELEDLCRIGKGIMHLKRENNLITFRKSKTRKTMQLSLFVDDGDLGIHVTLEWGDDQLFIINAHSNSSKGIVPEEKLKKLSLDAILLKLEHSLMVILD